MLICQTSFLDTDYNDATFNEFLVFLRDCVPESVKVAEDRLASFRTCQPVLQSGREVRQGRRKDFASPSTAQCTWSYWTQVAKIMDKMDSGDKRS